ncbi:MAG: T9SS type A sorting domain-containing protein [Candidatus Aegiribacteria sp.]|nr:T9SS type A sorting domain-containing protein [Candidatus Aegiribacteria sp.]
MVDLLLLFIVMLGFESCLAESSVQTDWSGGPGTPGPVTTWSTDFNYDTSTRWYDTSSSVEIDHGLMHTIDYSFLDVSSVYAMDINNDGYNDVLGTAWLDDDITWWQNADGSGTSWVEHTIDGEFNGAESAYAEDINGDGYIDVLGAASRDDDITWWQNTDGAGTSWIEHTIDGDFNNAYCVCSDDFDGDGYMDVLGAARYSGAISWWKNIDGSGTSWTEHSIDASYDYVCSVVSEDVDNDGDMDVMAALYYPGLMIWWENVDGSGTSWTEHLIDGDFDGARCIYSQDVDNDGDMDVLGAAVFDYDITWWENVDGSGTSWIEHVIDGDFIGAKSVFCEDLDNDGDMDVVGTAVPPFDVSWWENIDGQGTSWVEHTVYGSFSGACCIYSEDINGDGFMDILGGAEYADDIAWWDLRSYPPEGSLESSILDTGCSPSPQCASIFWTSTQPAGTDLYLQYKSSDDAADMGVWSAPVYDPCLLSGLLNRYFLYRFVLETSDPDTTPAVHDVTLSWDAVSIMESSRMVPSGIVLLPIVPNPVTGSLQVRFSLNETSAVDISVFDISGRLLRKTTDVYDEGSHTVLVNDLDPGAYLMRMSSRRFTGTIRFVVIH